MRYPMRLKPRSILAFLTFPVFLLSWATTPAAIASEAVNNANAIEALFFGAGPLTPSDGFSACSARKKWAGFPRGTTVTVRLSTTVSKAARQAIRRALRQIPEATRGAIRVVVELTDDPNPIPKRNEVTSTFHPDPKSQGCPYKRGCTMHRFAKPGVFRSSRAVQPANMPVNAYVHDVVGHGILGMCHIDGNLIGGAQHSLMSGGPGVFSGAIAIRLTPLDIEAARTVYGSRLNPGDNGAGLR